MMLSAARLPLPLPTQPDREDSMKLPPGGRLSTCFSSLRSCFEGYRDYRTLPFLAAQNGQSRGRRFRGVGSAFGGGSGSSSSGSPSSIRWGTANTKRFSTL